MNESVEKFHRIVEKARKVNCNECISRKVCFLQKQIENLADRMVQSPFWGKIDMDVFHSADRTIALRAHEKRIAEQDKICRELKNVIALNCSLYSIPR